MKIKALLHELGRRNSRIGIAPRINNKSYLEGYALEYEIGERNEHFQKSRT